MNDTEESREITPVDNGCTNGCNAPFGVLNEEIQRLRALLADLLADCDNWGCAPDGRYAEALR